MVKLIETGSRMVAARGWENRMGVGVEWVQSVSFVRRKSLGEWVHNNRNVLHTTELNT